MECLLLPNSVLGPGDTNNHRETNRTGPPGSKAQAKASVLPGTLNPGCTVLTQRWSLSPAPYAGDEGETGLASHSTGGEPEAQGRGSAQSTTPAGGLFRVGRPEGGLVRPVLLLFTVNAFRKKRPSRPHAGPVSTQGLGSKDTGRCSYGVEQRGLPPPSSFRGCLSPCHGETLRDLPGWRPLPHPHPCCSFPKGWGGGENYLFFLLP